MDRAAADCRRIEDHEIGISASGDEATVAVAWITR
jgi:hypothetical protein